jgi:hypothetical protein
MHAHVQDTVLDLKKKFHAAKPKCYPARQRLTLPPAPGQKSGEVLKDAATLADCGLANGAAVQFKDLGPQVCLCGLCVQRGRQRLCAQAWRTDAHTLTGWRLQPASAQRAGGAAAQAPASWRRSAQAADAPASV